MVDDVPQDVAALDLVLDLPEYLADLVLDGVGAGGLLLEAVEVGEELPVHEVTQIVPGEGGIMVQLAVGPLGRGPAFPAVLLIQDEGVCFPLHGRFHRLVLLQAVQVLQEEQPGGLLRVVQLTGTPRFFPESVIDIFECLFEHGHLFRL